MSDLFNNAMVNNALKSLTPEQLQDYKHMGEKLYGKVDFENSKLIDSIDQGEQAILYIEEGLKSGLLPSDLTEDEVFHLTSYYGEKWYERYGFLQHEVPETGLSLQLKERIDTAIIKKVKDYKTEQQAVLLKIQELETL